ncbi:hypothetical protein D3C71_1243620 [compost metagenome]
MLDARIVHQNIDAPHLRHGVVDHVPNGVAARQVGAIVGHPYAELGFQVGTDAFDFLRIAKAIQHDVGTLPRQHRGNAKTDTAGGAGNYRNLSIEHGQASIGRRQPV